MENTKKQIPGFIIHSNVMILPPNESNIPNESISTTMESESADTETGDTESEVETSKFIFS